MPTIPKVTGDLNYLPDWKPQKLILIYEVVYTWQKTAASVLKNKTGNKGGNLERVQNYFPTR